MAEKKGISQRHPDYDANSAKWKRCRDAASGEDAIHAGGKTYLPMLAEEHAVDYSARVARSPFDNFIWRAVVGMRGMMLCKDPVVEMPDSVRAYTDDVDMSGTPLNSFVHDVIIESLIVGRVGVIIDYPQQSVEGSVTVAQAASLGLRPSLQKYPSESIINWKVSRIGNSSVLSLVVLTEETALPGGEFDHNSETRYRSLDLFNGAYRQRVYRINDRGDDVQVGEDVFPLMNNSPMSYIPFIFIGVDTVGVDVEDPPMIDVVNKNLDHYRVMSDYRNGLHLSIPTLFTTGYQPNDLDPKIYIGSPVANCLPSPDARAFMVEVASEFNAHRTALQDIQATIAVLSSRMIETQKSAVEAANTLEQRSKGEESQLGAMAQTISLGMTWVLNVFSEWAGATGDVKYELQMEAGYSSVTAQELTAIVAAWQAGGISGEAKFNYLQKRDFYQEGDTFEIEEARTGDAGPKLMVANPPVL